MSYSSSNIGYTDPKVYQAATSSSPAIPSSESAELKLYQAFIFSVPIFFTFILVFLFYLFYLRRTRVDWDSLRMRNPVSLPAASTVEMGLKKEVRQMLPIIVFNQTFAVNDTQCSVCLGDYESGERLQQIPACGHTFHMDCIDSWLSVHATCPLCRQSLLKPSPTTPQLLVVQIDSVVTTSSDMESEMI